MKNLFINVFVGVILLNLTSCQEKIPENKEFDSTFSTKESPEIIFLENGNNFDFSFLDFDQSVILRAPTGEGKNDYTDFIVKRIRTENDDDRLEVKLDVNTVRHDNQFAKIVFNDGTYEEFDLYEISEGKILPIILLLACCVKVYAATYTDGTGVWQIEMTWDCTPCIPWN